MFNYTVRFPISLFLAHRYIQRSIDMERVYLNMMNQSSSKNRDYLTEKELALYIFSILPDLRNARDMEDEFIPYYMITSSRKFFFFHDHLRKGQISIKNLAHSTTMEELLYLKQIDKYENDIDPKVFREQVRISRYVGTQSSQSSSKMRHIVYLTISHLFSLEPIGFITKTRCISSVCSRI